MFEKPVEDFPRQFTQQDMLAAGVRVALLAAGPLGAVIGEFVTQFVPRQRLDRLQNFVETLDERMHAIQDELQTRISASAPYAALVEEACLAAVRTPSDQRRRELAEILRTGLSKSDAELVGHMTLLRLLEQLNDAQVIILIAYGSFSQTFGNAKRDEFHAKHPGIFGLTPPSMNASDDEISAWAMKAHFEDDLVARSLLKDEEGVAKGSPHHKALDITRVGQMLLEAIGQPVVF